MSSLAVDRNSLASLKGKTVLITGGSSGFGLETAKLLLSISSSNKIVLLDRDVLPSPFSVPSDRVLFQQCDVTSWNAQREAFDQAIRKFGRIDAVFVNAGIFEHKDQFFTDELDNNGNLSEPDRRTIQVDLNAASDTVKLAIHWLRKNKNGGSIVMTSSLSGYQAAPGAPLYSAAKHGILGLMRALKGETAKLNIAISIIAPGITVTNLLKANDEGLSVEEWVSKMRKTGLAINSADSVALAACHLINSGMQANGKGVMIQENKMAEIEKAVSKSRPVWMGKEMWDLYRGVGSGNVFSRI